MNSSPLQQSFRVFDAHNPKCAVTIDAFDATEAILTARERYPVLARSPDVRAVAG